MMAGTAGRLGTPGSASGDRPGRDYGKRGARADGEGETIRVCLRLRPQNKLEESRRSRNCVELHKGSTSITVDSPLEGEYDFSFDRVFDEYATQPEVFDNTALPLARKLLEGYNCALVAYGQTGSGKTHTMMGVDGRVSLPSRPNTSNRHSGSSGVDEPAQKFSAADGSFEKRLTVDEGKSSDINDGTDAGHAGLIPRTIKEIFRLMAQSPATVEYIVRCSYVEIYLEKVLDLLNPANRKLYVADKNCGESDPSGDSEHERDAVRIEGASEVCCFDEADLVTLLVRGNAVRKISSNEMSTNSSRSHAVFIIKVEQKDKIDGTSRNSQMTLVDMAGSEMAGKVSKHTKGQRVSVGSGGASPPEAKMVNKTLNALTDVVKALTSGKGDDGTNNVGLDRHGSSTVPYRNSKLTRVLREAFGGNCVTTLMLNASSSSYSISETIVTIRFGQRCRRVHNIPKVRVDPSSVEFHKQVAASEKKQKELMNFVRALAEECRSLKTVGSKGKLAKGSHSGPIWDSIDTILEDSGAGSPEGAITGAATSYGSRRVSVVSGNSITRRLSNEVSGVDLSLMHKELETAQEEISTLKDEVKKANEARDRAETLLSDIQSEAAVLRTQNDNLNADKKKNMQDLIDAKNEIQILSQRKLEVEHNLRTSQFRENEATVFLRQFRRFYRRLLRNKAAQGTGDTGEITAKVPGVPDLNDLIDVDTLLLESGLIEEEEMHDDATVGTYRPSSQALLRSTAAAKKASKEAIALEKALEGEVSDDGTGMSGSSGGARKPMGMNVAQSENLDVISEMGDGGVSEAMGEQRASDLPRTGRGGADDLSSIGERVSTMSSAASGDVHAGESDMESAAGSLTETISPQSIISRGSSRSGLSAASIAHKQKILRTPSGRLTTMREKDLERDLLQMTERCIELQIALNEEKANVDILTNRSGTLSKKRLAQEAISLRQALDRKTHDLQAIIWKMNELHLINKTYNEKMANREQHVTYLEENLIDLQNTNRRLITDRQESEKKLRFELVSLKILVDGMTIPLWQFGECSVTDRILASRMLLPLRGSKDRQLANDDGSVSSHESGSGSEINESAVYESSAGSASKFAIVHVATQTDLPHVVDKGIMTDQVGNGFFSDQLLPTSDATARDSTNDDAGLSKALSQHSSSAQTDNGITSERQRLNTEGSGRDGGISKMSVQSKETDAQITPDVGGAGKNRQIAGKVANPPGQLTNSVFPGGKSASFQPRRTVRKVGPTIKPGVLKESKKKGGGSVASSGSVSTRRQSSLHPSSASAAGHNRPISMR
mmetsp:Transcript_42159/g.127906  ORF Transcript_42159/g.127906 Transcript_42159/m.127906 type:complete len:1293 (-) Transcript_42159:43-3921(-)